MASLAGMGGLQSQAIAVPEARRCKGLVYRIELLSGVYEGIVTLQGQGSGST